MLFGLFQPLHYYQLSEPLMIGVGAYQTNLQCIILPIELSYLPCPSIDAIPS
jgi:hypothetical protein